MFPDDVTSAEIKERLAQLDDDKKFDLIVGSTLINQAAATVSELEAAGAVLTDEVIATLPPIDLIADLQVGKPDRKISSLISTKRSNWPGYYRPVARRVNRSKDSC